MPIVFVPQLDKKITCEKGSILMEVLQSNEVPVASSCLGDGICGKCVVEIKFKNNSSPITELESQLVKKYDWSNLQRASCQTLVSSDLVARSTYW